MDQAIAARHALFENRPPAPVFPSLALCLGGALGWGLTMAAIACLSLLLEGRADNFHLTAILLIYLSGGLLAWPVALPLARFLTRRRAVETRFAAHFALLTLGTVAVTAFLFAMDYRLFYARWHEPVGTRIWMYQFVFTTAGAVYQFLVMGLRLYLPLGLPLVTAVSLWLARAVSPSMR